MRKIFCIALREYQAAVKTKSFVISLLILPIMMGGGAALQYFLRDKVDITERHFALVDRTPGQALTPEIEKALALRNEKAIFNPQGKQLQPKFTLTLVPPSDDNPDAVSKQRYELSEQVREHKLFGFADIGAKVGSLETPQPPPAQGDDQAANDKDRYDIRYQSDSPTYDTFSRWLEGIVNNVAHELRGKAAGLSAAKLGQVLRPVPLVTTGLSTRDKASGKIAEGSAENPILSIMVPFGLLMMMFMMVLVGATPLIQGVVEEKMQRIAEVLLGSVRPFQLMMGKLIGMVGVSLTLAAVYLGGAFLAAKHYQIAQYIPLDVLLWFVVFQVLAVVMYGSLFIAIGAACTDMRETQSLIWPVMLLACIPMFVWINVVKEPMSSFSVGISFFPFSTPMIMIARQAVPPGIPMWQPIAGVVVVLATTALCVYIAGRIFRVGILMQGKGANLGQLVKWVVRG
jgi:ABC-type Na+ efflux pump permease subunit